MSSDVQVKRRDSRVSKDDARIDYTSVLNTEDRQRRFSEDLVDTDVRSVVMYCDAYEMDIW